MPFSKRRGRRGLQELEDCLIISANAALMDEKVAFRWIFVLSWCTHAVMTHFFLCEESAVWRASVLSGTGCGERPGLRVTVCHLLLPQEALYKP